MKCKTCGTEFIPGTVETGECYLCWGGYKSHIPPRAKVVSLPNAAVLPTYKTSILQKHPPGYLEDQEWYEDRLGIYALPSWEEPCTLSRMRLWLDRLSLPQTWYKNTYKTSLDEFMELNPEWGLRAWLMTVLEGMEH